MLAVDPEAKYESDGGPGFADLIKVMRQLHVQLSETLSLLDLFAFNYLIGNADAHAKNYSVVYRHRKSVLAPLYDAVSTVVYPELSREFAMGIGGEMRLERIGREQFAALAADCGMSPKIVLSRLDALSGRIGPAAERLAQTLDGECPSPIYGEILKVIKEQTQRIS